jgi:type IV secretory pathway component VirB8
MRPDYVNGGDNPSIETWQEACVLSQKWADDARQVAIKRANRRVWRSLLLLIVITLAAAAAIVLLTTNVQL